jgi:hypothetical protein
MAYQNDLEGGWDMSCVLHMGDGMSECFSRWAGHMHVMCAPHVKWDVTVSFKVGQGIPHALKMLNGTSYWASRCFEHVTCTPHVKSTCQDELQGDWDLSCASQMLHIRLYSISE